MVFALAANHARGDTITVKFDKVDKHDDAEGLGAVGGANFVNGPFTSRSFTGGSKIKNASKRTITDVHIKLINPDKNGKSHTFDPKSTGGDAFPDAPQISKDGTEIDFTGGSIAPGEFFWSLIPLSSDYPGGKGKYEGRLTGPTPTPTPPPPTPTPTPTPTPKPSPPRTYTGPGQTPTPTPKEQKSMLPPGPGQEQRNIAPGPPPEDETSGGCKLKTTNSPGVVTKTISVMDGGELVGEVIANLPDNPNGTFTGTVEANPAGKTEEERARNQAKLNQVVIQVADQQTKPADKTFTCTIPNEAANQPLRVVVLFKNKPVVKTSVPVSQTPPPQIATDQLPSFAQTGRNLVIPHSCDGKVDPTDSVKVGGQTLPLLVETQQGRVVRDTSNALGSTELEFSEQGQVTRVPIQNMSVQISANKNRLKQGENAELKVIASGMSGITKPVGLEVVDNSAEIASLSGGNTQHLVIQPPEVGSDGSCTKTFTLTGKTPGAFNIKATLESPAKSDTHP